MSAEHKLRNYFVSRAKLYMYIKLNKIGWPDWLLLLKRGGYCFVELKATNGKLSAAQVIIISSLAELGHKCVVCYSKEDVDKLFEDVK